MASFADRIPTFNPYVQQLPVEAMVSVGMEKQKRYDEGIQKIQSSIDNVAGLDIVRDVDKSYLQSKLTSLGSSLKMVAAGDFSNYQLVNSVAGLANQIGRDTNVQNAVISTQRVRKGQKDVETAKQEGKSSPQNEDDWNTQLYSYLSDTNPATSFRGEYVPYTDLSEKYAKIAKEVEAMEFSYDQPFMTDSKGQTLYFDQKGNASLDPSKGSPKYDDALKSITTKGKSAQRILDNFYSSTTENDKRQLRIDGLYHYKNATVDTFKNDIVSTFALQKAQLEEHSTELSVMLKNPKITDKEKALISAKLKDINVTLSSGKIDSDMLAYLNELEDPTNLADFKVKIYTQKYLSNLAQDKSTESYKEEIKSNPYAQMNMEKKKLAFDVQKENTRIAQWNIDHQWDMYKWNEERKDKKAEKLQEAREKLGSEPVTIPGGVRTDIELPTSATLVKRITDNNMALQKLNNQFLSHNKDYTKAMLDVLADAYDKDPKSIDLKDNDLREYLKTRREIDHDIIRAGVLQRKLTELTAPLDAQLNQVFASQKGIEKIYTAKELYDFTSMKTNFVTTGPSGSSVGPYTGAGKTKLDTEGLLKRFKGTRYEPLAVATVKKWLGRPLTGMEDVLVRESEKVYMDNRNTVSDTYQKKLSIESAYLSSKMPEYMTMEGTLSKSNKTDMDIVDRLIADSMNPSTGMLDNVKKSDWNSSTVSSWLEKPATRANLDFRIIKNYDGSARFIVQHGTDVQSIPLSASYFNAYFPRYAAVSAITQIKSQILKSPDNTTNINAKGDAVNAAYTGDDAPLLRGTNLASIVRFDVEGAHDNTGGPSDKYQVRVYAYDGKTWHNTIVNQTGYIGEESIQDAINMIGTDIIAETLKK